MTATERWLATMWPLVRARLPEPPARVVEIGCGPHGGFVPMLRTSGYDGVGVDPEAPEGAEYRRIEFELVEPLGDVDAVVASASLHHVADPEDVLLRAAGILNPGGRIVVVEWAWEDFDEQTAAWCFARLRTEGDPGWLHRRRDEWTASGQPWDSYLDGWARREGLHAGETLLRLLDERFAREHVGRGAYFFADLAGTTAEQEESAIARGEIRATRIDFAGRRR